MAHSSEKKFLFSGKECEIMLTAFKEENEKPSAKTIEELAEQLDKTIRQIENFFTYRRHDLAKRREHPSDLFADQLHKVELAILERRHAEDIKTTAKGIRKLEKLMDVKKGTYNFFFDCYAEPKKTEKKVRKSEEKEDKLIGKEREFLSHFVKPKSSWRKDKISKTLPEAGTFEDNEKENLETPELIQLILLDQSNESLPGCSLETFELHYLLNKIHVFVKVAEPSNRTARWVFAKEVPEKIRFEEGTTIQIGNEQVEERRKLSRSSESVIYAISPYPLSAAREFICLLSRFFSTELHKVIAAQPNSPDFHVVLNWPEVQKCGDVDVLVNNGMTNDEFTALVRMLWTCPRLTITASRANDLSLKERFPGVLNVCLLSPCHFHRMQLLELNWNNTHVEVPKLDTLDYEFGPVEINEFFFVWMKRIKPNVDSVRFVLPCIEHADALQGLEKHRFDGNIRENKELWNSAHGFLRDNNWVSIIDIANKGGVHASIYSSDEFLDFIVWTPKE